MEDFSGFPAGRVRFTPLPNLFFSELLPLVDDLAELKVTLHVLWLLHNQRGYPRAVRLSDLKADGVLLQSLQATGRPPQEALTDGLQRAVSRGTLLRVNTGGDERSRGSEIGVGLVISERDRSSGDQIEEWYFANTAEGRRVVDKVRRGKLDLGGRPLSPEPRAIERPNIFVLYEQNIGLLSPIIADELRDAEQTYPPDWIEDAFREAAEQNVRKWAYVRSILERWASEGKDDGKGQRGPQKDRRWYTEDDARFIKR